MVYKIDPELDLVIELIINVPAHLIWRAWTTPHHLKEWFCPKPWQVTQCYIDLRQGGLFKTIMEGPSGEKHDNSGCYLEIVENQKLVWTDALEENYRPTGQKSNCFEGSFTGVLLLEDLGNERTKYTAIAKHGSVKDREAHEKLGFKEGWTIVANQMIDYIKAGKVT